MQFKEITQSLDILQFYGVIAFTKDPKNITKSNVQYLLDLDQSKIAYDANPLFSEIIY